MKTVAIKEKEDDRLFSSADMENFAMRMAEYVYQHSDLSPQEINEYILNEVAYEDGDRSFNLYEMPIR